MVTVYSGCRYTRIRGRLPVGNRSAVTHGCVFFCGKDQRGQVAIFTRSGQEWQLSSVSTEVPQQSQAGRLPVAGSFGISAKNKGCPRCGSDSYARCGSCGELGCWDSSSRHFTCGNCGVRDEVRGLIESVNAMDAR